MIWRTLALAVLLAASPARAETVPQQARFDGLVDRVKAAMLTDPHAAAAQAAAIETVAATLPDPAARKVALATAAWLEAEALWRIGDLATATPLIRRARALMSNTPGELKLKGEILLTSGSLHSSRTEVAEALSDYQDAHRMFVHAGDQRKQAISLICLAMLYNDAKDYPTALHYLSEALEAYPADPGLSLSIYNSRGVALQDQGHFAAAEVAFRKALDAARAVHSTTAEAQFLRNMARNDLMAGRLGQADATIAAARAIPGAARDDARQIDAIAAQAALQHGRARDAGQLVDRAFAGVDLTTTDLPLRDAHQTAVAVYRALGRSDRALAHLQALKRLDDRSTKLATQASTALMAARFDSANQDAKIARLRDAARLRQAREALQRAQTERTLWLGGAGATATIIILLLFAIAAIRRSRDQVRDANAGLAVTNSALAKALAAKTEFLATTSHEIRTPLNGILGMTQVMLADRALAAPTRDRLSVVHSAGLTMRSLVDDILDVAKMETGHLALELAPFDLKAVLEKASRLWTEQARDKGLLFTADLARCPVRVEGDAARVRQIAFNLLSNAIKFTASGAVTLTAETVPGGVRLTVADTGIGIAGDKHEAVFESFRQADTSTTRQFGGTGLGLSISRNLARAMGGEVALNSRLGEGATFIVTLPLAILPAPAPMCTAPDDGDTLLVIDRNPIARAMFRTLFAPRVATVAFAGSADEAAACFASGSVAHVLIDDATARASGDASAFIGDIVTRAGSACVSLLWPATGEGERGALMALGLTRVILKPVTGAALVKRLFDAPEDQPSDTPLVSKAA